jgi:hypothetical protein
MRGICGRSVRKDRAPAPAQGAALPLDLLLQHHQGVDQLLGARRAAGDVDIDGITWLTGVSA